VRTPGTRLQEVGAGEEVTFLGEEPELPKREPLQISAKAESAFTNLLFTSLKALSQRTVVALASLVDLALIGSAFALWLLIIANPTPLQLTGVAGYAVFVLCSLWMRR
jgi:hypothetical protein